jgi:hypothetical protein
VQGDLVGKAGDHPTTLPLDNDRVMYIVSDVERFSDGRYVTMIH